MTQENYDFSGMATVYGLLCGDGRTIKHGAFSHQDGAEVTLVYQHGHNSMSNILGHGVLRSQPDGMRIYARFNSTEPGQHAKALVQSKDIRRLSIYANRIKESNSFVEHGYIQEVSLVLAGANPGATIDNVIKHSDDGFGFNMELEDEVIIHTGLDIELMDTVPEKEIKHTEDEETVGDILNTFTEDELNLLSHMIQSVTSNDYEVEESEEEASGPTVSDIYDAMSQKKKDVLHLLIGQMSEENEENEDIEENDDIQQSEDLGEQTMTHNIFETGANVDNSKAEEARRAYNAALQHSIRSNRGTLRADLQDAATVLQHAGGFSDGYGIEAIDLLFPQAARIDSGDPKFYHQDKAWVEYVMNGVRSVPFSRIRTVYADLTTETAKAHGYITGDQKLEDVFEVFDRITLPQTIYKKQRLDRDDILDITEFDVVRWIKGEMRMQLREEVAQAILISDGRAAMDPDKIKEVNIRPILTDDPIYSHPISVALADDVLDIIDTITASHEFLQGSGNPTMFCSTTLLTSMLIARDNDERRIYRSEAELREALRVEKIVTVPAMKGLTFTDFEDDTVDFVAILVNLRDYTVGAVKAGETTLFEDFDLDYNQQKYLLETRMCGALTTPKAAVVIGQKQS